MVVRGSASASQDGRFSKKQQKEGSKLKIPPEYKLKVDFKKVMLAPINTWVVKRVKELLKGLDDEVLVGTIVESLKQGIDAKDLHYELTPFLCNNTTLFVKELFSLLHSASESESGIPQSIEAEERARLETRRRELSAHQAKVEAARERQRHAELSHYRQASHTQQPHRGERDSRNPHDMNRSGDHEGQRPHHRGDRKLDNRRDRHQRSHNTYERDSWNDGGFSRGRDGLKDTRARPEASHREEGGSRHQRGNVVQHDRAQRQGDKPFRRSSPAGANQQKRNTHSENEKDDLECVQAHHRPEKRSRKDDTIREGSEEIDRRDRRLGSADYPKRRDDQERKNKQDGKGQAQRSPTPSGEAHESGIEEEAWARAGGMGSGGFPREGRAAKLLQALKQSEGSPGRDSPELELRAHWDDGRAAPNSPGQDSTERKPQHRQAHRDDDRVARSFPGRGTPQLDWQHRDPHFDDDRANPGSPGRDSPQHNLQHHHVHRSDYRVAPGYRSSSSESRDRKAQERVKHGQEDEDADVSAGKRSREAGEGRGNRHRADEHKSKKKHKDDKEKRHKKHKEQKHHKHARGEVCDSPQL